MKIHAQKIPPSLAGMAQVLRASLESFASVLPIRRVILFGSHARGTASESSDVDLCLVIEGIESQYAAARVLRTSIGRLRGKPPMSLVPISPARLEEKKSAHDPFFETILQEGICIAQEN